LLWERAWGGTASDESLAVAAASDGSVYVAGTTTNFGAGDQDAFVLHLQPTGKKKLLDAFTWGGTGFETGAGVAVNGGTLMLAATTTTAPPYSFLAASARLSAPRGTLAVVEGALADVAGVVANPAAGAITPDGKHDLQRKLRGSARENRAIMTCSRTEALPRGTDEESGCSHAFCALFAAIEVIDIGCGLLEAPPVAAYVTLR